MRCLILTFLAMCLLAVRANGQSSGGTQTFSNIDLAVQTVRETFRISTGFERAVGDTDVAITLDLSSRDQPQSILDALIRQRPAYNWSLENGVYCVYPRIQDESLSQLIVANYVLHDATLREATEEVFRLPELVKWRSDHHAGRLLDNSYLIVPRGSPQKEPKKISLVLSNVPLRTILSQVALSFETTRWTITHLQGDQELISLHF